MTFTRRNGTATAVAALFMLFAATLCARAQTATEPEGTVTGSGTATIERLPDLLRMQVDVAGDGKDAREALANLRNQEKSAREKLAKLGIAADAVKVGTVRVAPSGAYGGTDQRAMLAQMIRARTGRAPAADAAAAPPAAASVHVTATVTAEWPLKAQGIDERIIEATDLQAKVGAATVVTPVVRELTPEEQELAEETAGMMDEEDGTPRPGEPVFYFVSKISDDDRAKATAQAFASAKSDAARLARAAQANLGPLRNLSSTSTSVDERDATGNGMYYGNMNGVYGVLQRHRASDENSGNAPAEAVGTQPANVTYRVTVSGSFAIKGLENQ